MRKYFIFLIAIVALVIVAGVGCNNETTELAWINEAGSDINDIVWSGGDQTWSKEGGYADNEQTESKKVTKLDGTVEAAIFESGEFQVGTVTIKEAGSNSLSLNEGSSEVYTIDSVTP